MNEAAVWLVLVLAALVVGGFQSFERVGAGPVDSLSHPWAMELQK